MWIGEGYKENEKEKEMAGNRQEHIKHIKNTILSKEAEDSSLIVQAHQGSSLWRR